MQRFSAHARSGVAVADEFGRVQRCGAELGAAAGVAPHDSEGDWVSRFADEVIAEAAQRGVAGPIVCASGLSPSGPVHLGNLREVMIPHLVADEIKRPVPAPSVVD
ncbi:hypothetical protein Lfu02_03400 [Longispora fulva]|uniref:Lysine--tRNA ligase n=1 Tax=Longispora fulva TaxID=619741 RepID=A0A8J7GDR7_9ACTN|nr:hypothetical protein [Longispora fulva]MBG6135791.1 hypothetical protein [Longispora fulva]GIG55968.1 hypothetical protein Lfu02_03400 [Longispora fulva]